MKGENWGALYAAHKDDVIDPEEAEAELKRLVLDDDVSSKRGIHRYILTGDERHLNIRAFTPAQRQAAYERQGGHCPRCDTGRVHHRGHGRRPHHPRGLMAGRPRRRTAKCSASHAIEARARLSARLKLRDGPAGSGLLVVKYDELPARLTFIDMTPPNMGALAVNFACRGRLEPRLRRQDDARPVPSGAIALRSRCSIIRAMNAVAQTTTTTATTTRCGAVQPV